MSGHTEEDDQDTELGFVDAWLVARVGAEVISELGDRGGDYAEHLWIPHDADTTFRWTRRTRSGQIGSWSTTGIAIYGEITGERLRSIRMTGESGPSFHSPASRFSLRDRPHKQEELEWIAAKAGQHGPEVEPLRDRPTPWEPRSNDESSEDFYRRVALCYRELEFRRPHDPTQALAELAEVPFTTAVHWVRVCRDRKLLPKSKRQTKGQSDG